MKNRPSGLSTGVLELVKTRARQKGKLVKRKEDKDRSDTWAGREIDQLASLASEIMPDAESLVQLLHNWVLKLNKMALEESERGKELRKKIRNRR
jgi:hypothetical protein